MSGGHDIHHILLFEILAAFFPWLYVFRDSTLDGIKLSTLSTTLFPSIGPHCFAVSLTPAYNLPALIPSVCHIHSASRAGNGDIPESFQRLRMRLRIDKPLTNAPASPTAMHPSIAFLALATVACHCYNASITEPVFKPSGRLPFSAYVMTLLSLTCGDVSALLGWLAGIRHQGSFVMYVTVRPLIPVQVYQLKLVGHSEP